MARERRTTVLHVRLRPSEYTALEQYAAAHDLLLSEVVRAALALLLTPTPPPVAPTPRPPWRPGPRSH